MSKTRSETRATWREGRRESARAAIVEAAWAAVRDEGLAALSLRDLARRAGITTPTVYAYFASKNAIYDAMFGDAALDFERCMAVPYDAAEPHALLVEATHRFARFCTDDVARYELLFQRTIRGFEPSPESYAPAVRALDGARGRLARAGVTSAAHVDLWTAILTGLVSQQISNDPGGDRWLRLVDDVVSMYLSHCRRGAMPRAPKERKTTKGATQ